MLAQILVTPDFDEHENLEYSRFESFLYKKWKSGVLHIFNFALNLKPLFLGGSAKNEKNKDEFWEEMKRLPYKSAFIFSQKCIWG